MFQISISYYSRPVFITFFQIRVPFWSSISAKKYNYFDVVFLTTFRLNYSFHCGAGAESPMTPHRRGGNQETPRRHQETPRRLPGDTQEIPRRHPGDTRRHPGDTTQETSGKPRTPRRHPGDTRRHQETPRRHPGDTHRRSPQPKQREP